MKTPLVQTEIIDLAKVGTIGSGGLIATVTLSEVSDMVSIGVGVATFCYIVSKLIVLWWRALKGFDEPHS